MTDAARETIDLLLDARWVLPMAGGAGALKEHSVAVDRGRIVAVLPTSLAHARFDAREVAELAQHALIPGLINLHLRGSNKLLGLGAHSPAVHAGEALERGAAISARLAPQQVHAANLLAGAEMLLGGITCFAGADVFPEAVARAALEIGMRASVGLVVDESPSAYAADADDYLAKGLELRDRLRDEPLLSFGFALLDPGTVGDRTLQRVLTLAEELDLPVLTPLHESQAAISACVAQHGMRPVQRLQQLGLLGPNLVGLRVAHLTPDEIALIARHGAALACSPTQACASAAASSPLAALMQAGVATGLCTDYGAGQGRIDLFQEMRLAARESSPNDAERTHIDPLRALSLASLGGARVLRLEHLLGSIEAGKQADLVAIELREPDLFAFADPAVQIACRAGREHVSHVWVSGRMRVEGGTLKSKPKIDLENLLVLWQNTPSMETTA